jgi:hypothetical protein
MQMLRKTDTGGKQESAELYVPLLGLDRNFEVKELPQFFQFT